MAQFQKRVNIEVIDANNGQFCKIACMSCIRGHRTTSCGIANCRNKVFWTVKRPGRPSNACNCAMVGGVCICTLSVPICPHKAKRGGKRSVDCRCDEQGRFCCYVTEADWDALSAGIKPRIKFFENREDLRADGDRRSNSHTLVPSFRPSGGDQNGITISDDTTIPSGDRIPIARHSVAPIFGFMGVGAPMGSRAHFGEDVFQWDNTPPAPRQFRAQTSPAIYQQHFEGPYIGSNHTTVTSPPASLVTPTGESISQQSTYPQTPSTDSTGTPAPAAYMQQYPFTLRQRVPIQQPPQAPVDSGHVHTVQPQLTIAPQHVTQAESHDLNLTQPHFTETTANNEVLSPIPVKTTMPEEATLSSCCSGTNKGIRTSQLKPDTVQHTNGSDSDDLDTFMQQYVLNQAPGAMCQQCGRRNCSCSMCPPVMQTGGTSNWGVCGRAHEISPHTMHHASTLAVADPNQSHEDGHQDQNGFNPNAATLQFPHTCCQDTFLDWGLPSLQETPYDDLFDWAKDS